MNIVLHREPKTCPSGLLTIEPIDRYLTHLECQVKSQETLYNSFISMVGCILYRLAQGSQNMSFMSGVSSDSRPNRYLSHLECQVKSQETLYNSFISMVSGTVIRTDVKCQVPENLTYFLETGNPTHVFGTKRPSISPSYQ
jgi:hypothetical protein